MVRRAPAPRARARARAGGRGPGPPGPGGAEDPHRALGQLLGRAAAGRRPSPVELSAAVYRLGRAAQGGGAGARRAKEVRHGPEGRALEAQLAERAPELDAWGLSQTAWGLGWLGWGSAQLGAALEAAAQARLGDFTPQGTANLVWGLARQGHRPGAGFVDAVAAHAGGQMAAMKPMEFVSLLQGLAAFGDGDPSSAAAALRFHAGWGEDFVRANFRFFKNMELVKYLDALRGLGHLPDEEILAETAARILRTAPEVPSVCRYVWLCAKLGYEPEARDLRRAEAFVAGRLALGECKPVDVANFVWGCQQIGFPLAAETLEAATAHGVAALAARPAAADDRDVASLCWALAGYGEAERLQRVVAAVADLGDAGVARFRPWSVCMLLGAVTKLDGVAVHARLLAGFEARLARGAGRLGTRDAVEVLGSFAKLDHRPGEAFVAAVGDRVAEQAAGMEVAPLARVLQLLAPLQYRGAADLAAAVEQALLPQISRTSPFDLSSALLGFVRAEHAPGDKFVRALHKHAYGQIKDFGASDLAIFLWAATRLGAFRAAPELYLRMLGQHFCAIMHTMSPLQFCQALWSIARLADRAAFEPLLFSKSEVFFRMRYATFSKIDICTVLHSFALAGWRPVAEVFENVDAELEDHCRNDGEPGFLSNVMWSYAKLRYVPREETLLILAEYWAQLLDRPNEASPVSPQAVSQLVWCLSRWDYRAERLLGRVEARALRGEGALVAAFGEQDLANLAWGMYHLDYRPGPALAAALTDRAFQTLGAFTVQGLLNFHVAAGALAFPVSQAHFRAFVGEVQRRGARGELGAQDVQDVVGILEGQLGARGWVTREEEAGSEAGEAGEAAGDGLGELLAALPLSSVQRAGLLQPSAGAVGGTEGEGEAGGGPTEARSGKA